MNKENFLKELEFLLSDVSQEEREEALQYYEDFFEEAGADGEKELLERLGSPEKVAAEIKGGLSGAEGAGEFTEQGYRDKWYEPKSQVPDHYTEIVAGEVVYDETRKQDRRDRHQERAYEDGTYRAYSSSGGSSAEGEANTRSYKDGDTDYGAGKAYDSHAGYGDGRTYDAHAGYGDGRTYDSRAGYGDGETYDSRAGRADDARTGHGAGGAYDEYDASHGRGEVRRKEKRNWLLILILFFFIGLPLGGSIIGAGFSIIAAIIGAIFGIFGGLLGLVGGGIAGVFGLFAGGLGMIFDGLRNMASPAYGTVIMGGGFFLIALGFLLLVVVKWACTTIVPGFFRFCLDLVRKCFRWLGGLIHRFLGIFR